MGKERFTLRDRRTKYKNDDIERFIHVMVAVSYIDIVYDAVPIPILPQENVHSYGNFDGIRDSNQYDRTGAIWCGGYGKSVYTDLHDSQSHFFLVYFAG